MCVSEQLLGGPSSCCYLGCWARALTGRGADLGGCWEQCTAAWDCSLG